MDNNPNIPTHAQANPVALKLPIFWPTAPEVWFMQAEAEFDIKGITGESTKFSYLVASLPQDVARQTLTTATDLARNPNRYTALKERLMVAYSLTPYQRACQLLDGTNIGNQRPSAMLREMQAVRGNDKTDLFTALFLRRLTEDVRAPLVHSGEEEVEKLAVQADRLWLAKHTSSANAILKDAEADSTEALVAVAIKKDKQRGQGSGFQTWKASFQQLPGGPCAYHAYYGAGAKKCVAPCFVKSTGNAGAGRL